jgi:hypothetical protein
MNFGNVLDSDLDLHGSALVLIGHFLIMRIRIQMQEDKKDQQYRKKGKKFHALNCWMFSFQG